MESETLFRAFVPVAYVFDRFFISSAISLLMIPILASIHEFSNALTVRGRLTASSYRFVTVHGRDRSIFLPNANKKIYDNKSKWKKQSGLRRDGPGETAADSRKRRARKPRGSRKG